jgi:hypothetical protein
VGQSPTIQNPRAHTGESTSNTSREFESQPVK